MQIQMHYPYKKEANMKFIKYIIFPLLLISMVYSQPYVTHASQRDDNLHMPFMTWDDDPEGLLEGDINDFCLDTVNVKLYWKQTGAATTTGWVEFTASNVADADYGEITVASGIWTIDDDVIGSEHFKDQDWGDITIASGVATVEDDSHDHVTTISGKAANVSDADFGEITVAAGVWTVDDDIIGAEHFADQDWGDITISTNVASIEDDSHLHGSGTITEADPLALLTAGTDNVKDTHPDWGTGAGQISAVDIPIADGGGIITGTEIETALQENRTAIDLNTAKNTNVPTALSVGTVGINTVAITSDGGADDVTLPAATVATAGLLTTAKWAEIVASTTHLGLTNDPHSVTKAQVGLTNVEDVALSTWVGSVNLTTLGTIATGTWQSVDIGIAYGGTGQSTAQAAIDALTAVSAATNEHVLTKDTGTGNAIWKAAAGGFADPMTTRGDIIIRDASNNTERLGIGANTFVLTSNGTDISWAAASGGGASTALDNLASVAINTDLILGTTDGGALGSITKMWSDLFLALGGVINWNNGDLTLTHSANLLTLAGGDLALGANNLGMTGSLGLTGSRVLKGWFADLESTNDITIGGVALATIYQPLDAALTNISSLVYVSDSFIKLTADDTYAVRTIAETKTDLSLNLVENTALSTWAGTSNLLHTNITAGDGSDHSLLGATPGTATANLSLIVDVNKDINLGTGDLIATNLTGTLQTASQTNITGLGTIATGTWQSVDIGIAYGGTGQSTAQAAIDALTQVSGATNEYVLTKDTGTGNAVWKIAASGGAPTDADYWVGTANGGLSAEIVVNNSSGLAGALDDETGTGLVVFNDQPLFETDAKVYEAAATARFYIDSDTDDALLYLDNGGDTDDLSGIYFREVSTPKIFYGYNAGTNQFSYYDEVNFHNIWEYDIDTEIMIIPTGTSLELQADNNTNDVDYTPQVLHGTDATPPTASNYPRGTIYIQYEP